MQIDFTNPEITMLILSTDTVVDRFSTAWKLAENQVDAQRAQRRLESVKALQEKLMRSLPT